MSKRDVLALPGSKLTFVKKMIALLLCLVPMFTPGLGETFHLFNSSLALPFDQTETNKKVVDYFPDFL